MSEEKKPTAIEKILAERKKAEADRLAKIESLKSNIGKAISFKGKEGVIVGFQIDKMLGAKTGDAFLCNFGNPNRNDFVFCDEILTQKEKE